MKVERVTLMRTPGKKVLELPSKLKQFKSTGAIEEGIIVL